LINNVVFSSDGSRVASGLWHEIRRVRDVVSTTDLLCYDAGRYVYKIELSDDSIKIIINGDLLSVLL
jgi:hypothetical protein